MDGYGINFFGYVTSSVGVEIDKGEGGDGVVALVAGDENPLEGAASADAVAVAGNVVVDLRVVDFEYFGEVDGWGVDEHEVAGSADGEAVGDGFVGADFAGVGFGFGTETSHGSVKA